MRERHAILRTLRAGQARLDRREVELDRFRVHGVRRTVDAEESLLLRVVLDQRHLRLVATSQPQVVQRHVVDREDGDGRAILRAHVAERRAVGDGERIEAFAEELDELADHSLLAERLR